MRGRTFGVALLAVATFFTAAWIVNPPVYFTNDDVSIRQTLEGSFAPGEPASGFTLMTHAALGWPLVYLYRALPAVPWWDLVVAVTLIGSLAMVAALVWDRIGDDWLARALCASAMVVMLLQFVPGLQYTIAATLAGSAAVLIAVDEAHSTRPRRKILVLAALALLLGLFVRTLGAFAGVVAVSLLFVPLVAAGALRFQRVAPVMIACAALFGIVQYGDGLLYATQPEWRRAHAYQWMIVRLFEWRGELPDDVLDSIRSAAGWTRNDFRMVQGYFGVDPAVHGYESMARVYDASTRLFGWEDWVRWGLDRMQLIDVSAVRTMVERSAAPLALMVAVAVAYSSARGAIAIAAIAVLFLAFCVGVEATFKELPFRLLGPFQVCAVAVSSIAAVHLRRLARPVRAIIGVAIVLSVMGPLMRETAVSAASMSGDARALETEVRDVVRMSPSLLVLHADTFRREYWWRPFRRVPLDLPAISLNWNNQNPLLQDFLAKSGRDGLLPSMCADPSVLVVADEGRLDVVTTFFAEHRHTTVTWTPVYSGSFPVWRCSIAAP